MTIRDAIRNAVERDPRPRAEIARAAGTHGPNLSDYLNGVQDLRGESIDKLIAALGLRVRLYRPKA